MTAQGTESHWGNLGDRLLLFDGAQAVASGPVQRPFQGWNGVGGRDPGFRLRRHPGLTSGRRVAARPRSPALAGRGPGGVGLTEREAGSSSTRFGETVAHGGGVGVRWVEGRPRISRPRCALRAEFRSVQAVGWTRRCMPRVPACGTGGVGRVQGSRVGCGGMWQGLSRPLQGSVGFEVFLFPALTHWADIWAAPFGG